MDPGGSNALAINKLELSYSEGRGYGYYALLQPTP
jgi:hypothetical protein